VVEAIFGALAIRDQLAPPTMNLHNPGEGCDLDYVPLTARKMRIEAVLSNSFGFGGTNGNAGAEAVSRVRPHPARRHVRASPAC